MQKEEPIEMWGSCQAHRSIQPIRGGYGVCPTIGTTDFGLPRVMFIVYEEDSFTLEPDAGREL